MNPRRLSTDPGAAAGMDACRFSTEPWMASRKIPALLHARTGGVSGKTLSLVTFFWSEKKATRLQAEALDLDLDLDLDLERAAILKTSAGGRQARIKCFRLKASHFLCEGQRK
ncbi:hypothetical protein [Lysobacter sp. D1-1-M9]|uniref:hypothetical protein n=1 Tax=Novilysobacter longmucuonensis TaxID=3098603 RepID=UPI002FCC5866